MELGIRVGANKKSCHKELLASTTRSCKEWLEPLLCCLSYIADCEKEGRRHPPGLTEERNAACFFGDLLPGYKTAGNDFIDSFLSRCSHGFI